MTLKELFLVADEVLVQGKPTGIATANIACPIEAPASIFQSIATSRVRGPAQFRTKGLHPPRPRSWPGLMASRASRIELAVRRDSRSDRCDPPRPSKAPAQVQIARGRTSARQP